MADVVYGEQVLSGPLQELVSLFEKPGYDGTLYLGYPILSNVEGTVKVDGITSPEMLALLCSTPATWRLVRRTQ